MTGGERLMVAWTMEDGRTCWALFDPATIRKVTPPHQEGLGVDFGPRSMTFEFDVEHLLFELPWRMRADAMRLLGRRTFELRRDETKRRLRRI